MPAHPYWIVGPGRLGMSLGSLLLDSGAASELVFVGRDPHGPTHPLLNDARARYTHHLAAPPLHTRVLITVPDGAIGSVADGLARCGAPGQGCIAIHASGAVAAAVLAPLARLGYATGSLHPLQTVADPDRGPERLRGAFFAYEGDTAARTAAAEIVAAADGQMLELDAKDKARYHAACVFASNYLVACASVASRLLAQAADIPPGEATRALTPLWEGAVANLRELGLPAALTGPITRGDLETIRGHLSALGGEVGQLYRRLGLAALDLSRQQGLSADRAGAIESELRGEGEERERA